MNDTRKLFTISQNKTTNSNQTMSQNQIPNIRHDGHVASLCDRISRLYHIRRLYQLNLPTYLALFLLCLTIFDQKSDREPRALQWMKMLLLCGRQSGTMTEVSSSRPSVHNFVFTEHCSVKLPRYLPTCFQFPNLHRRSP